MQDNARLSTVQTPVTFTTAARCWRFTVASTVVRVANSPGFKVIQSCAGWIGDAAA